MNDDLEIPGMDGSTKASLREAFSALERKLAEEQARGAALREALAKVDEIACRTVTGNHPEDLPEPANRDGEELAKLSREAIALPADSTALDAALKKAREGERKTFMPQDFDDALKQVEQARRDRDGALAQLKHHNDKADAAHALNVFVWRGRVNEALDAMLKHTAHENGCLAYKVIGRFGSRTGLRWVRGDEKKCDCGIAKMVAEMKLDPMTETLAEHDARLLATERAKTAAAEARELALRKEWRARLPCGRRSHDHLTCDLGFGHGGFHGSTDGARVNWPESEAIGWDHLPPALAAPTDSSALRALMLKVCKRSVTVGGWGWDSIVDAVLRGEP